MPGDDRARAGKPARVRRNQRPRATKNHGGCKEARGVEKELWDSYVTECQRSSVLRYFSFNRHKEIHWSLTAHDKNRQARPFLDPIARTVKPRAGCCGRVVRNPLKRPAPRSANIRPCSRPRH